MGGHGSFPSWEARSAIAFEDVRIGFDEGQILRGVSFCVRERETVVLLGETGTGKTLTLKMAAGLLRPDSGSIDVLGQKVSEMAEKDLLTFRRKIGFMFQEGALFDSMTVADNVAYRLHEEGVAQEEIEPRVREVLRFVEIAVGDVRVVLQARHREQIVAVARLPYVHQIGKPLTMIPEVARADFNPPRGPVMRMARDAQTALTPDLLQDLVRGLIGADPFLQIQTDDVGVLPAAPGGHALGGRLGRGHGARLAQPGLLQRQLVAGCPLHLGRDGI